MATQTHTGRKRFTVEDYHHRMAEAGILKEDDRVELIEGEVIRMAPIGSRYAACVKRLNALLGPSVGENIIVSVQDPIRLNDLSEPEPDVALLSPRKDFYSEAHSTAEDVLLVAEVFETSVEYDRETKLPLYARAGIPEAWLIDLPAQNIEIYTRPSEEGYRETLRIRPGETLRSKTFSGLELWADELLR
jgi:Uma2 family endonuclease